MSEFTATSGASIKINPAPWADTMALKSAIGKELSSAGLSALGLDLSKGVQQDIKISDLAQIVLAIDASPLVYKAVFGCLARCTYNGQRITEATFEDENARQDYYEIVLECVKVNLAPFLKGLLLKLSPFLGQVSE